LSAVAILGSGFLQTVPITIRVLEAGLVDVWQKMEDTVGDNKFQQDGAKIHTARDTMAWFAENHIQVMEWPRNSPNLNPIQYCWKRIQVKLPQHFPHIHKTKEGQDTIRRQLAEALNVVWTQDIEGEFLERLWKPKARRVAAVLDAKGWYTEN